MTSIKEITDLNFETTNHRDEMSTGKRSPSNKYILQGAKSTRNLQEKVGLDTGDTKDMKLLPQRKTNTGNQES